MRREQNQWRALVNFADRMEIAGRARKLLAAMGASTTDWSKRFGDRTAAEWFAWAQVELEKFDSVSAAIDGVLDELSKVSAHPD